MRRRSRSLCIAVLVAVGAATLAGCADTGTDTGTGSGPSTAPGGGPAGSDDGGPITVAQLVARSADTPVAVRGLLHVSPEAVRLCGAVMESHPVQCGQPWVELVGLDVSTIAGTTTAEGVTWREGVVLDVVRDVDGRYRVVGVGAGRQTEVVLGIYSGRPDPTWALTAEQADELAAALAGLVRVAGTTTAGGLGYHGFTIIGPDGTLVAFDATVTGTAGTPTYHLADPDRTIERFLLETARPHLTPDELAEVERALR